MCRGIVDRGSSFGRGLLSFFGVVVAVFAQVVFGDDFAGVVVDDERVVSGDEEQHGGACVGASDGEVA